MNLLPRCVCFASFEVVTFINRLLKKCCKVLKYIKNTVSLSYYEGDFKSSAQSLLYWTKLFFYKILLQAFNIIPIPPYDSFPRFWKILYSVLFAWILKILNNILDSRLDWYFINKIHIFMWVGLNMITFTRFY